MKVIYSYFILIAFLAYAIAFPYGSQNLAGGISEKIYSENSATHAQDQREKRQFDSSFVDAYPYSNNYEPSQQFFDQNRPIIFNQRGYKQRPLQEFQRSFAYSNIQRTSAQPEISRFHPNDNQQYFQLQGIGQPLNSDDENIQERQFQNQRDQLTTPFQKIQWFPASSSRPTATNLRWNEPTSINADKKTDPYGRQFSGYRQIHFNAPLQPIKFTNKNPSSNYQSNNYQTELPPLTQTSNRELLYFPSSSGRTFNQDSSIQPANIYYDIQNTNNANPNVRQIIPTPQEVVNSALSIGSNFIQNVPGYNLTTNTIGVLRNITRFGAQYFVNNGLPILSPNLPSFLFPFQNRPLDLPPPYDTPYTTVTTVSTTTPQPQTTTPLVITNRPIIAADVPASNDNYDQPNSNPDDYDKGSQENSNDSRRDESNDDQHSSQENNSSSDKNSHEDRIQTEGHSVTAQGSASEEENNDPSDNNSQVVASDILPDEDYGIADDDDKIDTKAIKTIVG